MNISKAGLLLGVLASASAMATDYSVGIVDAGSQFGGAGTALDLFSISPHGVTLVKGSPLVFEPVPGSTYSYDPVLVALSPAHDLVYAVYVGIPSLPILVQFKATPHGLQYRWQQEVSTGDATLQGTTISTSSHYLIENTYPDLGLWIHVIDESGEERVSDPGSNASNLVSGHIDPAGEFYYSCRDLAESYGGVLGPANAVAVYRLDRHVTESTPPLLTSTDPVFVQSVCRPGG
jgi:hypothetical protein